MLYCIYIKNRYIVINKWCIKHSTGTAQCYNKLTFMFNIFELVFHQLLEHS